MRFPLYRQLDSRDCGIACLRMVAAWYGKKVEPHLLGKNGGLTRDGLSLLGIMDSAEQTGFIATAVKASTEEIKQVPLPAILHWQGRHFVVLYKIKNNRFYIADPSMGKLVYNEDEFLLNWKTQQEQGVVLALEPGDDFFQAGNKDPGKNRSFNRRFIFDHLRPYRFKLFQLLGCLLLGSLFQFIFPYVTQAVVDRGIKRQDLELIQLLLLAQFVLFFAQAMTEFIRARLLLFISTRINFSILGEFWKKLMKLPMAFFESKNTGDLMQRISDHRRIESFITGSALNSIFSVFSLIVFSVVLFTYRPGIFLVFFAGSILYFLWIRLFLARRKKIDQLRFTAAAKESSATLQVIYGMQEIKLNGAEEMKRKEWQVYQRSLFDLNFRSLSLGQYQQAGAFFINQGKNILITFLSAIAVLNGQLTLGEMLAIQVIIGQLNGPVEQLIQFVQQAQEARLSVERLMEVHRMEDEVSPHKTYGKVPGSVKNIFIRDLSFNYPGNDEPVLNQLDLDIPARKITALVGMSGTGKTTLIKTLLQFFDNYSGSIQIGETELRQLKPGDWRKQCGTVLQDGYIFSDSILRNIALGDPNPDEARVWRACEIAEISDFINSLPQRLGTKIGSEGAGLSAGQKQRILIARSVYKEPSYLFYDEATNALDSNNEKAIMENLQAFFRGRTVIIAAHRLSTIINADKIVVMDKGRILEEGTHEELLANHGAYYRLVSNQLPAEV